MDALTALYTARLDASVSSWDAAIRDRTEKVAGDGLRGGLEPGAALALLERESAEMEDCLLEYRAAEYAERAQVREWERRATLATADGRADLARQAATRTVEHLEAAEDAEEATAALEPILDACRAAITALRASIGDT